jgi:GT2 family glycosyltransferase
LATGRHRLEGHGEEAEARAGVAPVAALSGAALMLRAAAFERAGPLDEGYFHGFEDVDWCLRLGREGYLLGVVQEARVRHAGGRTLGAAMPERLHYAARNHVRVVERLAPRRGAARWLRRFSIAALSLAHALRQGQVPRRAALRAVLAGTRDGWSGASGPLEAL